MRWAESATDILLFVKSKIPRPRLAPKQACLGPAPPFNSPSQAKPFACSSPQKYKNHSKYFEWFLYFCGDGENRSHESLNILFRGLTKYVSVRDPGSSVFLLKNMTAPVRYRPQSVQTLCSISTKIKTHQ
jgi:hypothetical protein